MQQERKEFSCEDFEIGTTKYFYMITFNSKRTIESSFTGNNDVTHPLIVLPKATCGFKIVDAPEDKSCTFFAITLSVTIVPTGLSTYNCKLQSVTDILRDTKMKPLVFSMLASLMETEFIELSNLLDEDLKKHNIVLDGKINLNEKPDTMKANLKIEFDKYQPLH